MKESPLAASFLASNRRFLTLPKGAEYFTAYQSLIEELRLEFRPLLKNADEDGPEAWFAIGHAYNSGWGPERDRIAAKAWFLKAAEAGHSDAMVRLASITRTLNPSSPEHLSWLRKAADLGNTNGMIGLGFAYRDGQGLAANKEQALTWLDRFNLLPNPPQ